MRGPAGTPVRLSVRRVGAAEVVDVALKRAQVEVHSVASGMLDADHGYLRINTFTDGTADEVTRALLALKQEHAGPLAGLVIDLRNNPGGLLESAVEVADDFLDSGNIVSADGRAEDARFRMDARPGDLVNGAPIALLINGNSASAAEILAGALHDNHRATLVGRRSYGKGSVQTVTPLSAGRAIKLTTSRYFTPSGASINQVGIQPDIAYEGEDTAPAAQDAQVMLALESLRQRKDP
jgi:carboxyl-terminal processing protease